MQRNVEKFGISDKRGRKRTSTDHYATDSGLKEPAACQTCKAIYRNKRWQLDAEDADQIHRHTETHWVNCPACQKVSERYPEGVLTLRGDYLWSHEEEINNILANEAQNAMAKNPLQRIIQTFRDGDSLVIETTEQKLAEHLSRTLNRAHRGDLQIDWSETPRACRVSWERWQ